jgi:hypothetical protein
LNSEAGSNGDAIVGSAVGTGRGEEAEMGGIALESSGRSEGSAD